MNNKADRFHLESRVKLESCPAPVLEECKADPVLTYCSESKELIFEGSMSWWQKRKYNRLSDDEPYRQVIGELYRMSNQRNLNSGLVFVTVFRWLLILLTALVFEKLADGICVRITGESFFRQISLWINIGAFTLDSGPFVNQNTLLVANWQSYAIGISQLVTTLLFLVRYFLCLIDGIERKVEISVDTDFSKPGWQNLLSKLPTSTIVGATLISVMEFILLYHAVISVPSTTQWLFFLLLLVLVDTVWFLGPNVVVLIVMGTLWVVNCAVLFVFSILFSGLTSLLRNTGNILKRKIKCYNYLESKREQWEKKLTVPVHREEKHFKSALQIYWKWNLADLLSIVGCLYCIMNPNLIADLPYLSGLSVESLLALLFSVVYIAISIANFTLNNKLYRVHINILSVRQVTHVVHPA